MLKGIWKGLWCYFHRRVEQLRTLFEFFTNVYNETQSLVNIAESSKFEIGKMISLILKLGDTSYMELLNGFITNDKLKSILVLIGVLL